ncbi:hypothetical protein AAFF_G00402670 [Aldrovandia affinis]|uniref:Uncharacterized protein n=1 Tax=Aldrovandia affinis TaxID=143900 RepID=A0AAD7X0F8_9TELE|nr:hypothetical protein AAFF_G00402670 [Aldrovandia affinis]
MVGGDREWQFHCVSSKRPAPSSSKPGPCAIRRKRGLLSGLKARQRYGAEEDISLKSRIFARTQHGRSGHWIVLAGYC